MLLNPAPSVINRSALGVPLHYLSWGDEIKRELFDIYLDEQLVELSVIGFCIVHDIGLGDFQEHFRVANNSLQLIRMILCRC